MIDERVGKLREFISKYCQESSFLGENFEADAIYFFDQLKEKVDYFDNLSEEYRIAWVFTCFEQGLLRVINILQSLPFNKLHHEG